MRFLPIYFAFAAGYLLSYLYRTVNAVISPELVRDLSLEPSSLGLLTSAYFLGFAAMQMPVGMLLDRYGPRRVEPVLLSIAACGAFLFAYAESRTGLAVGRAIIGAGSAACLMAPLKAIATWYPRERQASYSGWVMVAGGVGALVATVPLEFALRISHWRVVFVGLGIVTLLAAFGIWWRVPDIRAAAVNEGWRVQFAGVRAVFVHPRFWWIAPLAGFGMGSFMAIQGLWAVPWLMEVEHTTRANAANQLFAMNFLIMMGYVALGFSGTALARRGVEARHLFAGGFAMSAVMLVIIWTQVPGSYVWWSLYGLGASVNVLAFTTLNEGFGRDFAGRTNTTLNLLMFGGSFISQWGIGVVVDAARSFWNLDNAGGLRVAFAIVMVGNILTYIWFVRGWRRHGVVAYAATPA
ncbi:MAG: MFS transporter [Betaproteobacteria bacterium]